MKKSINSFLAYSGVRQISEKKMTMAPMTGFTITVEGADEEEIRKRFTAAMSSLSQMWESQPEAVLQRLK